MKEFSVCTPVIILTLLLLCDGGEPEEDEDVGGRHVRQTPSTPAVCDDGETGILVDLEGIKYECEDQRQSSVEGEINPSRRNCSRPESPLHKCMSEKITYTRRIPHSGMHRLQWAKYGDYTYLPPQRWVHNIELGAVVALYAPCAPQQQVAVLKQTVQRCLRKHIITPYTELTQTYPFALSAWGCTLEMSRVDVSEVQGWIIEHALQSGEESRETKDGQYSYLLIQAAEIVSDEQESVLCPDIYKTTTTPVSTLVNSTQHADIQNVTLQANVSSDSPSLEADTVPSVSPTSFHRLTDDRNLVTGFQLVKKKKMIPSKQGKHFTSSTRPRKPHQHIASATVRTQPTDNLKSSGSVHPVLPKDVVESITVDSEQNSSLKTADQTQQTTPLNGTDNLSPSRTPHRTTLVTNHSVTTNGLEGFHQDQAYWALGSLVFLIGLLCGAVYYTKLWKKKVQGEMFKKVETFKIWEQDKQEKLSIPGLIRRKFDLLRQKTTRYHLLNQQEVLYSDMFSDDRDSNGDSAIDMMR